MRVLFLNKKFIAVVIAISGMILSSLCLAESLWQGTTYGMSMNEVRATIPQLVKTKPVDTQLNGQAVKTLQLDNIQIVNSIFSATFYFAKEKLIQVVLLLDSSASYQSTMDVLNSLTTALRKKYGKEIYYTQKNGLVNQTDAEWLFKGTQIKLSMVSVSSDNALLKLTYQVKAYTHYTSRCEL